MPRLATEENSRLSFRINPKDKALIMRAVSYRHTDLTNFAIPALIQAAQSVIEHEEKIQLSEQETLKVLNALENPPAPNKKLLAAAFDLPDLP